LVERRYLLERPQLLGIIPTRWFWRDMENWRLVRWPFGIFVAIMVVVLSLGSPHPIVAGLIAGGTVFLAQGLLERYIRKQALKRRALAEHSNQPLPPSAEP
jgi:hypothetical protein